MAPEAALYPLGACFSSEEVGVFAFGKPQRDSQKQIQRNHNRQEQRALCHLVLKQYKEAVKDCTEALRLDGRNVKAFYRRAQAYKALKDYTSSFADINSLLQIEPRNGPAQKLRQEVNRSLN